MLQQRILILFLTSHFNPNSDITRPTVCLRGAWRWAGVDSAWEQEKLEARKLPENAQTPTSRVHAVGRI